MINAYAVRCRYSDVGIIRNALVGDAEVRVIEPDALCSVSPPPDVIFFGWGGGYDQMGESDEDRRMRNLATTCILLRKIRNAVAFRDVPILIVIENRDTQDVVFTTQFGAYGYLAAPLEGDKVRDVVLDAMRPVGSQASIDVRLVNPFVGATVMVLERLAKVEAVKSEVLLKKDYRLFGEISAIIGITGKDVEGSVGITFQDDLANQIVARMWNRPTQELSQQDVNDGLGELLNVISGQATTEMSKENDLEFSLALPSIVCGFGHEIHQRGGIPCLVIVFRALRKLFAVQVAISTNQVS